MIPVWCRPSADDVSFRTKVIPDAAPDGAAPGMCLDSCREITASNTGTSSRLGPLSHRNHSGPRRAANLSDLLGY